MSSRQVRFTLTAETVAQLAANDDLNGVLEPIAFGANFYEGREVYEKSIAPFSTQLVHLYAVNWYAYEVLNGGHDQYFCNSTGLVTRDALAGLKAMSCYGAIILEEAINRFGGWVPDDRDARYRLIESRQLSFDDLDERFDDAETWDAMYAYPKANIPAFCFDGVVTAPHWRKPD